MQCYRAVLAPKSSVGLPDRLNVPRGSARIMTCRGPSGSLLLSKRIMRDWHRLRQPFQNIGASAGTKDRSFTVSHLGRSLRLTPQRAPGDGRGRPGAGGIRRAGLVWFRGDLRLHDHEALAKANSECSSLLPVYCFDPRDYEKTKQGYERTGPYQAQFLLDAVADLRARLRKAGSELVVRWGRPEEVLPRLAARVGATAVYCHKEVSYEGRRVEGAVAAAVEGEGCKVEAFWGGTLHHLDDLPFKVPDMPQHFDKFRERTAGVTARAALAAPAQLRGVPIGARVEPGELPTLQQLGLRQPPQSSQDAKLKGGETEALRQLRTFLGTHAQSVNSGEKRSGAACGSTFANNIAPWLAVGCLSPRHMREEAQKVLAGAGAKRASASGAAASAAPAAAAALRGGSGGSDSLSWVNFELLWRDFFRFITLKYSTLQMGAGKAAATQAAPAAALA